MSEDEMRPLCDSQCLRSDGGGMMRRWGGCGDEVRGGCDDGDDDESGGVMVASIGRQSEERGGAWRRVFVRIG
ncbi:hypothetical protein Tco_0309409 [Tanacetum coccineum]